MKLNLKFEEEDFENMKTFEKAVKRQLGKNVYVGTNSLCFYFDYPKELVDMIRPFPSKVQLEFNLDSCVPDQK